MDFILDFTIANRIFFSYAGKCIHEMIAHLGEVSCLDIDLEGLYLLSGGKS